MKLGASGYRCMLAKELSANVEQDQLSPLHIKQLAATFEHCQKKHRDISAIFFTKRPNPDEGVALAQ